MKKTTLLKTLPVLILGGALVFTAVSSAQTNSGNNRTGNTDTPPKKHKQIRDLDDALLELDRGEAEMMKAMKEFDSEKIGREIREAMKNMDVDMARAKEEIAKAMKEIDMQKISLDVQKALKEVDAEKIKAQVQQALAQVDMKKVQVELDKVKDIDFSKMKVELENIRPEIEKSLQEAKKSIEKARIEITSYKQLVEALDKDGLLKKEQNYKIEYKNSELTVNGKKLSADEAKKYSQYLNDKKDFMLQKEDDNFNIDND